MDDTSDLSSSEESDLFDKIYNSICNDRPWEFLKNAATGSLSTTVPYVSLPASFSYILQNANHTDSSYPSEFPVVWVSKDNGVTWSPFKVVSWSDRRQYRNRDGYCYVDIVNSRLVFALQPTGAWLYEFDYKAYPTALALTDTPAFPSGYHDVIYHGMCVDEFIIQQSDKAKSYLAENQAKFTKWFTDLAYWNANLIQQ